MNHLPQPLDGHAPSVNINATRPEYHPSDFFSLFGEPGLDFDTLLAKGYTKDGNKENFLQEWLFFALLAQFLNTTIYLTRFESDGILNTEALPGLLQEWRTTQRRQLSGELSVAQKLQNTQTRRALADARRYVEKHCSMLPAEREIVPEHRNNNLDIDNLDVLYLSFAILGETLEQAVKDLQVPSGYRNDFWINLTHNDKSWGYSSYNHKTLLRINKCPAEVRRLESTFSGVLATYCASTMKPSLDSADTSSHTDCSLLVCSQVSEPEKWHFANFCHGKDKDRWNSIPPRELEEIVLQGQTPLLTWEKGNLVVKGYDLQDDDLVFGALSHRWKDNILVSEGQSNSSFKKEALTCQLEALQHAFNHGIVHKPPNVHNIPFWVDSLCTIKMPPDKQSLSISETRHIYKKASMVLVWDRGLLQTDKDESKGKIAHNMRIRASPWARRMWTLLESIVSRDLVIAFKNGTYNLSKLEAARDKARKDHNDDYHLVWKLGDPYSPAIADLRTPPVSPMPPKYYRIACLWRAVQFRLVTAPEDETIILANVLGLDVSRLFKKTDKFACEERMVKFLELLDETPGLGIPPGIIFLPGPALRYRANDKIEGYGWAPKTWLSKRPQTEANPLLENVFESFIGKQGLFVTYPGVLLHCAGRPAEQREFWVPVDQHLLQWYNVITESPDVLQQLNKKESAQLGLILSTKDIGQKYKIGVLVRLQGQRSRGNALWVFKICRVWIRLETDRDTIGERVKEMRSDHSRMFFGEKLSDEQLWCVDRDDQDVQEQ